MICTSIQNRKYEEILDILDNPEIEMAEIRLDRCELTDEQTADELKRMLSLRFPSVDVSVIDGGQPVYHFIISVE